MVALWLVSVPVAALAGSFAVAVARVFVVIVVSMPPPIRVALIVVCLRTHLLKMLIGGLAENTTKLFVSFCWDGGGKAVFVEVSAPLAGPVFM